MDEDRVFRRRVLKVMRERDHELDEELKEADRIAANRAPAFKAAPIEFSKWLACIGFLLLLMALVTEMCFGSVAKVMWLLGILCVLPRYA